MSGDTVPGRRRRRTTATLLVAVVAAATLGILGLVVQSSTQLGRMTTDVSVAQQRATNLSNAQREGLRLLQQLTDLGEGATVDEVAVQRGLFVRQVRVGAANFPFGSPQERELEEVQAAIGGFPWERLENPRRVEVTRRTGMALVAQSEGRIKALYDEQEKFFYAATIDSLQAKRRNQTTLVVLVSLVGVLSVAWVVMLKRRTRSDVARAYDALVEEMAERRSAEDALRASEARFRSLVQRASDLTTVTDAAGNVTYVSPAAEGLLGHLPDDLVGGSILDHVDPAEHTRVADALARLAADPGGVTTVEVRLRTRDGRWRSVEAVCQNLLADPDVRGIVWNGRDVTDRRALENQLTHQAYHDLLTGLPNRALFLQRLEGALRHAPKGRSVSVVLIDLDGFKNVNDTLGHAAGDELLQRAAERLRGCVLHGDTAARLGGDEFAVVVPDGVAEHAVAVGRRIIDAMRRPIRVGDHEVTVGASVGVAHRDGHTSEQDLLRDADIAMYAAKRAGKGRTRVFERDMRERTTEHTSLQQQLARAVELGEIEVHYQPLVDLSTWRVTAVEALARWRHPHRGLVPPSVFIPVAEESGTIDDIGGEVLEQACRTVQRWRTEIPGHADLCVAVNVSVRQVLAGTVVDHVVRTLAATGLPARALTLELTESMLLEDSAAVHDALTRLKQLGVRLAVDDFGAGYSSLGSLLDLDADVVKIDRSLLDFDTASGSSLVQAVCGLGRTLGLEVVAEGVETADHLDRALAAGCDAVQGYHLARPRPADNVGALLRDGATWGEPTGSGITRSAGRDGDEVPASSVPVTGAASARG
jgi:diguanylate cyclase (GGDEF)-like protein/PAS domain S-box-containing protein